jgi:hypothetical protein
LSSALDAKIAMSASYLTSLKAAESLTADPYWPKWDSPWWHMTLLWELGRADAIPKPAAEAMLAAIEAKYVKYFPNPREPLPEGKDYHRDGLCHCGLGNMYQTLSACGIDVDGRAPWMRAWFLHYQLPDGGVNCDEKVYEKGGSSSVQSTLPVLEAVLAAGRPLTPVEESFVDRGAEYLLERRLAFRASDPGRVMAPEFLEIGFPRFYDYDFLRGIAFITDWARVRRRKVQRSAVGWVFEAMDGRFPDARVRLEKPGIIETENTLALGEDGKWSRAPSTTFSLLDAVRKPGTISDVLSRSWAEVVAVLGPRIEG